MLNPPLLEERLNALSPNCTCYRSPSVLVAVGGTLCKKVLEVRLSELVSPYYIRMEADARRVVPQGG